MLEADQENAYGGLWYDYFKRNDGVPRDVTKRLVMTLPYGLQKFSAPKYVNEWYEKAFTLSNPEGHPMGLEYRQACKYLGYLAWDAAGVVVRSAAEARDWLQEVAGILGEEGQAIRWYSPTGFPVVQEHPKYNRRRVRTALNDSVSWVQVRVPVEGSLNTRKQVSGFPANYVHSIDAAIRDLAINKVQEAGVSSFSAIHDSFGTHAADYSKMAQSLRGAIAEIFSGNLLMDLYEEISATLSEGISIPKPPDQGTLDPNTVLESPYIYS